MEVKNILKAIDKNKQLQEDEGGAVVAPVDTPTPSDSVQHDTNTTCSTGLCNTALRPLYGPLSIYPPYMAPVIGLPMYNSIYTQMGHAIKRYRRNKAKRSKR